MARFAKAISTWLEEFPRIWRFFFRVYGVKSFRPEQIKYRKRANVFEEEKPLPIKFEIIFDAQCLQTLTRQRGIGKYSLSLIESICKVAPEKEFAAYLTNIVNCPDLEIAKALLGSLKCSNLTVFVLDPFESSSIISFNQSQERILNYLKSFSPNVIISLSNFEKPERCIPLPQSADYKTSAILYDLIPLQFSDKLLISRRQESTYRWLLANLQGFDYLLSISKTTKNVWRDLVSNSTEIRVISGAGYVSDKNDIFSFEDRTGILCIGAEQEHKNLKKLISAYSNLSLDMREIHKLTIVGIRSKGTRKNLTKFAKKSHCIVSLPRYLTVEELQKLYQSNRILVMPSLSEGLSLPILDAWANGLPAIGSAGTVAAELIDDKSLLFDPTDPISIAHLTETLLCDKDEWERALGYSLKAAKGYSWELTARLTLNFVSELGRHE